MATTNLERVGSELALPPFVKGEMQAAGDPVIPERKIGCYSRVNGKVDVLRHAVAKFHHVNSALN